MNTKEVLQSIKKLLFEDMPEQKPEEAPAAPAIEEFKEYSLADGTKVKIDKLEIGGKVMVVTADGTEVKAPEGEHMLSSGEAIEVDAEGLIYEIKSAVAAQPEQMRSIAQKFAVGTPEERIQNLETLSKALMEYAFGWELRESDNKAMREAAINVYKTAGFEDQLKEKQKEIDNLKEVSKQLFSLVESLSNEAGAEETPKQKEFTPKTAKEERFKAAMDALQSRKK